MTAPTRVTLAAPAKLNLGLAVLGRRDDGFHELATILQAVGRYDDLTAALDPSGNAISLAGDDPAAVGEPNLAVVAAARVREWAGSPVGLGLTLAKTIPVAAGLGGASTDAAAALLATRCLLAPTMPDHELEALAAGLGSDVPFFLTGGTALATGRGERLTPLPTPARLWFVVVCPLLDRPIARKTATLYAALTADDFGDGREVAAQAALLRSGAPLDPHLLGNAFARPLLRLRPELAEIPALLRRLGAPVVALSGAGPCHYVPFSDPAAASDLAARVAARLPRASVFVAPALTADEAPPTATG